MTLENFYSDGQMELVLQYNGVTSLEHWYCGMSYADIWRLVDAMPNLEELAVRPNEHFTEHGEFVRLMQDTNLESIGVIVDEPYLDEFRGLTLPEHWFLDKVAVLTRWNSRPYEKFTAN